MIIRIARGHGRPEDRANVEARLEQSPALRQLAETAQHQLEAHGHLRAAQQIQQVRQGVSDRVSHEQQADPGRGGTELVSIRVEDPLVNSPPSRRSARPHQPSVPQQPVRTPPTATVTQSPRRQQAPQSQQIVQGLASLRLHPARSAPSNLSVEGVRTCQSVSSTSSGESEDGPARPPAQQGVRPRRGLPSAKGGHASSSKRVRAVHASQI